MKQGKHDEGHISKSSEREMLVWIPEWALYGDLRRIALLVLLTRHGWSVRPPPTTTLLLSQHTHGFRVQRLLLDKGSKTSTLFVNCWERMSLPHELIYPITGKVANFDGHKSSPKRRITLIISVMETHMAVVSWSWTAPLPTIVS